MNNVLFQVLEVKQASQAWYIDVFRSAMWSIAKGILWLLDGVFDVINKIWKYKFFENPYVTNIFNGAIIVACSWLILKVILEIIMNHIVNNDGKSNPLSMYRDLVYMFCYSREPLLIQILVPEIVL